jgi:DNA primase
LASGVAAEVKSKLSIVDVVGESVQLRKAGTTLKGLCPFHGEKTPSFVVTPARESWHCFGCGEGGDIFSFVMRREGLTFPEALKRRKPASKSTSERPATTPERPDCAKSWSRRSPSTTSS